MHHPFKRYAENLYEIRKLKKEADDPTELVIKLMMNSLYGKFGQKLHGKEKIYHIDSLSYEELKKLALKGNVSHVGEFIYHTPETPSHISTHIMPIYALYTTAYGRIKLYDAMKGINPIYCDTDSIITHDKLPESKELGCLKLEYGIKEGIFIRPKMYAFKTVEGESVVRIKGNNASWNWDYDRFKQFIADPRSTQKIFSTFKASNRKGIPFNSILTMEKEFGMEDDKREWKSSFDPLLIQNSIPICV